MNKISTFMSSGLLFTLLFIVCGYVPGVFAQEAKQSEWDIKIGAGYISSSSPWTGSGTQSNTIPFIRASIGNWHFGGRGLVNYQTSFTEQWGLVIGIDGRDDSFQHDFSNDEVFSGYKAPDNEIIAKFGVSYNQFSVVATRDVSNNSESSTFSLNVEHPIYRQKTLIVKANASANWFDSDYVNYNYGVSNQQADDSVGRFAYQTDAAVNFELGISATYFINREWIVIGSISQTRLDDEITDSPLIEEDYQRIAAIVLVYQL